MTSAEGARLGMIVGWANPGVTPVSAPGPAL